MMMGLLIDQDKRVWTESFLHNEEIMEVIKVGTVYMLIIVNTLCNYVASQPYWYCIFSL